jgi:hypothetical protein
LYDPLNSANHNTFPSPLRLLLPDFALAVNKDTAWNLATLAGFTPSAPTPALSKDLQQH